MRAWLAILLLTLGPVDAYAQARPIVPGGELDQYLRVLELDGLLRRAPLVYRSPSSLRAVYATRQDHGWAIRHPFAKDSLPRTRVRVAPLAPSLGTAYNSAYARSVNDGALWAGRGVSAALAAGAEAEWGPLSLTVYPEVVFAQNSDFSTAPVPTTSVSPLAYPWRQDIDFPQRFGDHAYSTLDWGQSDLRFRRGAFTAGLTTENLWWGPAFRNPIIMSTTAAGFPHIDLGTGWPVQLGRIGRLEARVLWGALSESAFFDRDATTGRRFLTGFTVAFAPDFVPGLTLGGSRVLYQNWRAVRARDVFGSLSGFFNPGTIQPGGRVLNDSTDQLLSVIARWVLPTAGFGAYLEWARNDFSGDLRDFLLEPDASAAQTIGVEQLVRTGSARWRLRAEATRLGPTATSLFRGTGPYYNHSSASQGYTHRGQLLGAGIGPGGSSQHLGIDRYDARGRWGFFVERVRFEDDGYFERFAGQSFQYLYHDVELTLGVSALRFLGSADVTVAVELSRRLNRYFVLGDDVTNLKLETQLRWARW